MDCTGTSDHQRQRARLTASKLPPRDEMCQNLSWSTLNQRETVPDNAKHTTIPQPPVSPCHAENMFQSKCMISMAINLGAFFLEVPVLVVFGCQRNEFLVSTGVHAMCATSAVTVRPSRLLPEPRFASHLGREKNSGYFCSRYFRSGRDLRDQVQLLLLGHKRFLLLFSSRSLTSLSSALPTSPGTYSTTSDHPSSHDSSPPPCSTIGREIRTFLLY